MSLTRLHDLAKNPQRYDFVQAMRLLEQLSAQGGKRLNLTLKAEAMPSGTSSEVSYFSSANGGAKLRLAKQALSGVKGVIPDYIYEEMLTALHRDDNALKDFLDVFNQRHFEISYRLESQAWLLLEREQQPAKTQLLKHLATLEYQHKLYFQYSLLLGQRSRNPVALSQILNDYFPYKITVQCSQAERRQLPTDSLTRLGCQEDYNSRVGQGFLLGNTGLVHFNRLTLTLEPSNRAEFLRIQSDTRLADEMVSLSKHYLRDNTVISVYLNVRRSYLQQPSISAKSASALRLGEVDCLAPQYKPNELVKILLR
ncbi:type VI secretion system baseplate subunit TssG [Vibrio proteolyticus]